MKNKKSSSIYKTLSEMGKDLAKTLKKYGVRNKIIWCGDIQIVVHKSSGIFYYEVMIRFEVPNKEGNK